MAKDSMEANLNIRIQSLEESLSQDAKVVCSIIGLTKSSMDLEDRKSRKENIGTKE